jgi:two-component system alkaline phosphatase synthesis response regulator PhoP
VTETKERIVIVEDDASIREGLELNLRLEGYSVRSAAGSAEALTLLEDGAPDLLLLDLMLPDGSGLDLLRRIRQDPALCEIQVLILSALGLESDKVRGLRLGADDYVTKPFGLAELLARIDASLRRRRVVEQAVIRFGEVTIDPVRREVTRGGETLRLTPREHDLLLHLARHMDRVFSREQLLQRVWGDDYEGTARTVDNFVRSLRAKLEPDPSTPRHLLTVHGLGYKLTS